MCAIFKREFKSYFQSVIGWLFLAATLCLFGLYFYVYNLVYGYPNIANTLSAVTFLFLLTVPVLTMRTLAEERKNKTDQLILTAPVSVGKVVAAKFLAMGAIYTIAIAVMAVTPLILSAFGSVPFAENYVALLGFWLYGLTCIAIGLFVSSLTESQVISAVVTFALLFLGYMMDGICSLISTSGNWLTKLLGCYDMTGRLDNFFSGMFDVGGVIYYISVILLFLFLTVQSIQKRRWSMSKKKIGLGVFNTGMVAFGVALAVILNLVVGALPTNLTQLDATSKKLYSLTDDTKELLKGLSDDVTIYVLAAEGSMDETVAKTLERYDSGSSHLTVEYKDPSKYPSFYTQYTDDTSITRGSLIVVSDKRNKVVNYNDIYEGSYDSSYNWTTTGYDGEGQITSAIQYVTGDDMPVIYQLEGHGESTVSGNFLDAIEKANITTESINLLKYDAIPEDAEAIIINGPTSDFSEDDAKKVSDYLAAGGKAFITTTYTDKDMTNFKSILSEYDVTVTDGVVMEGDGNYYYQQPYYLLPEIKYTSLTSSAMDNYIFAPSSQGLTYPSEETGGITYTELLATSDSAYAKTDVVAMETFDKEEGDVDGPFALGLEIVKSLEDDKETRLIVYSCTGIFADNADEMVSGNNGKLFASSITSLAGETEESTTVIPVKEYSNATLTVSAVVMLAGALLGIVLIPLILLITGIVIWVRRRKR